MWINRPSWILLDLERNRNSHASQFRTKIAEDIRDGNYIHVSSMSRPCQHIRRGELDHKIRVPPWFISSTQFSMCPLVRFIRNRTADSTILSRWTQTYLHCVEYRHVLRVYRGGTRKIRTPANGISGFPSGRRRKCFLKQYGNYRRHIRLGRTWYGYWYSVCSPWILLYLLLWR